MTTLKTLLDLKLLNDSDHPARCQSCHTQIHYGTNVTVKCECHTMHAGDENVVPYWPIGIAYVNGLRAYSVEAIICAAGDELLEKGVSRDRIDEITSNEGWQLSILAQVFNGHCDRCYSDAVSLQDDENESYVLVKCLDCGHIGSLPCEPRRRAA